MLRVETGLFSVTLDKKRKIGSFSNCSGQEIYLLFLEVVLQWPFKKQREGHQSAETD